MKRRICLLLGLLLILTASFAAADKARFLSSDGNSSYHASHLESHVGLIDCRISTNYLKVRTSPGGSNVLGHVEQADTIELIELSGKWAQIRVTYSAPTSPDSWQGLQGWVDSDYVECPCSSNDYYGGFSGQYSNGETNTSGVNVRELPSQSQRSLFTLNRGTSVVILGEYQASDGTRFYRILTSGKTGFVRQDMIDYTGGHTTPVADEGLPNKGGIGADPGMPTYIPNGAAMGELAHDSTNVRQSAGGTVTGRLRKGTVVAVLSDTTDRDGILWYYVSYGNNQRGYIRADLIDITGYSNGYQPVVTQAPYYYSPVVTQAPYTYYQTATPTPVPYNYVSPTAVPSTGYNMDYTSIYNSYIRNNWRDQQATQMVLQDIDGDGVPECFVWADVGTRGAVFIYSYSNGYVVPLNANYTVGQSTRVPGVDRDNNSIGGGGYTYFASYGIGFLAGGSNSASEEEYMYFVKSGFSLVTVRDLVIRYTNYSTTYLLDGRTATENDVRAFLSVFQNAGNIIGNGSNTGTGTGAAGEG